MYRHIYVSISTVSGLSSDRSFAEPLLLIGLFIHLTNRIVLITGIGRAFHFGRKGTASHLVSDYITFLF